MPILRAQSAMEYLATYGWAILIITVAFAALYALGVFDINTYSTGALPGSCQVYRPYGPGTQQLITLQGVCTSGKPKFVAYFKAAAQQPIEVSNSVLFNTSTKQFTAAAWVKPTQYGTYGYISRASSSGSPGSYLLQLAPGANNQEKPGIYLTNAGAWYYGNSAVPLNTWSFVVVSFNSGNVIFYVYNSTGTTGASISSTTASVTAIQTSACTVAIGTQGGCVAGDGEGSNPFIGAMADVQLYNTTVSANTIRQMHVEGVGGEPITIQNLIGWWPLNGDTNDYSGNGDNGAATGIIFVSAQANIAGGSIVTVLSSTSTTATTTSTSTSTSASTTSTSASTTSTTASPTSTSASTTSTTASTTSTTITILVVVVTYTSNSVWTKPANLAYAIVEVYGAGGGGGGAYWGYGGGGGGGSSAFGSYVIATGGGGGGAGAGCTGGYGGDGSGGAGGVGDCGGWPGSGGGGGAYAVSNVLASSLSSTVTIVVGTGGGGGGSGGSSVNAVGGSGYYNGGNGDTGASMGHFGGAGGGGSSGDGSSASSDSGAAGGTGASVGSTVSAGQNGVIGNGGSANGGSAGGPSGGAGGAGGTTGASGTVPGGGGGGSLDNPYVGGKGAAGEVVVTEYIVS